MTGFRRLTGPPLRRVRRKERIVKRYTLPGVYKGGGHENGAEVEGGTTWKSGYSWRSHHGLSPTKLLTGKYRHQEHRRAENRQRPSRAFVVQYLGQNGGQNT